VVFFLYDLAGKGADDLIQLLKLTKRKAASDDRSHDARVLFAGDPRGITILSEPSSPLALRKKLLPLAEIAKYKSKADAWLALGSVATSTRLVDALAFAEYDWKYDSELEELATHFQGKMMTASGRKIGRNQPCPCGNGKKFKHCHGK
jgi:SEC-C motif